MKAKFPLSLRQRLSASPALRSLRKRQSIQTDPLQTDFSVDLTCCAARHAPYCGGLLCRGASCYYASCGRQSNPLFLGTLNQPIFFFRPRGRREGLAEQAELLEIVTYGFAAHQRAHHIEVVGVGHVPHPRGHPPAEGGVHEFNKLFVERGSQEVPLLLDERERESSRRVIQKLGKYSPKL